MALLPSDVANALLSMDVDVRQVIRLICSGMDVGDEQPANAAIGASTATRTVIQHYDIYRKQDMGTFDGLFEALVAPQSVSTLYTNMVSLTSIVARHIQARSRDEPITTFNIVYYMLVDLLNKLEEFLTTKCSTPGNTATNIIVASVLDSMTFLVEQRRITIEDELCRIVAAIPTTTQAMYTLQMKALTTALVQMRHHSETIMEMRKKHITQLLSDTEQDT